jgi:hypothetical protein
MAINIYPEACEFTMNTKKNYDIIFFAQRCNESLVKDNDKWQYNGTTSCPSSIFSLEGSNCCHCFVANTIWINVFLAFRAETKTVSFFLLHSKQASHDTVSMLLSSSSIVV